MKYETVIGLEIHCELKTESKIFCSCPNKFGAEENENVCPVCLGMPGTLPVLNEKAVECAIMAGIALNCEISLHSKLDRKNYFYPDLPKAYQISQYEEPLCRNGWLEIELGDGSAKKIRILRIHIEEDAGKLVHRGGLTLLDNNRCGVPLIEIVTEPDMRSPAEAELFARKVRSILLAAGVSDCRMQEGSLRFDVNLSVRPEGGPLGTRTETKNLNSFRSLIRSAEHERARQIEMLDSGEPVRQQTRRWDDEKGVSYAMRSKEDAHDYRYFPDPDLVEINLTKTQVEELASLVPELPDKKRERYIGLGLSAQEASLITVDPGSSSWFEAAYAVCGNAKAAANFVSGELTALMKPGEAFEELKFSPAMLGELIRMADAGEINLATAKKVLAMLYASGGDPKDIIEKNGMRQVSDENAIRLIVLEVLEENPQSAADIKGGKKKAIGFVVGQAMKRSKGAANPAVVNRLIEEILNL
ncbi:MAG: Asp-tRNA(Asn)/Glu-tRNA(Gln) amidotransferase subunit GatB [Eubacteriaceae bacterium]|jgi:aspartyl-tRNA(Asn)/glutamyl-tRNA(Gln) amidotransferase subunit B|nr:Asp-tRNA(Asn)/Glu-tRNA(Gln) amidotransferase subunit GatB [Eubacteriaceae bacterium]